MGEDSAEQNPGSFVSLSQPLCSSRSHAAAPRKPHTPRRTPGAVGDGQQLRTNETLIQRKDIMALIAELTLQNYQGTSE